MCRSRENKNTAVIAKIASTTQFWMKTNASMMLKRHAFKLDRAGRQPISKARGSEKEKKKKYVFLRLPSMRADAKSNINTMMTMTMI